MTHSLQSASSSSTLTKRTTLQRLIAAGNLRYWIIVSWALALATTAPPAMALGWMIVALASGLAAPWWRRASPSAIRFGTRA